MSWWPSENAWRRGGAPSHTSTMYAAINSRVKVIDLLHGAIIQSGNDACIVLAEGLAGSQEAFAEEMNKSRRMVTETALELAARGFAICGQHHSGLAGDDATTQSSNGDYIPHHEPFQYYPQTVNPHHVRPSSPLLIGTSGDGTNHHFGDHDSRNPILRSHR